MPLNVAITELADSQIQEAYIFCFKLFSESDAERLKEQIYGGIRDLAEQPYMGKVEPLLENLRISYRSWVVHRYYKIIYTVDEVANELFVVAVWDTRQNPKRLRSAVRLGLKPRIK